MAFDKIQSPVIDVTTAPIKGSAVAEDYVLIQDSVTGDMNRVLPSEITGWKTSCRGQAEMEAFRDINKDQFAASGFVHYGKHVSQGHTVNEGVSCYYSGWGEPNTNRLWIGRGKGASYTTGNSKTDFPVTHIAGFISNILGIGDGYNGESRLNAIKFPEAPDGTVTYNSATGEVIQHVDAATAFAYADANAGVEVVINRVDMFGGEFFLEEVSETNPFVYPKGMIQSQATSMNGIPTTTSNRPITYYAVYDGDTTSRGLGVDFFAATEAQKQLMVSDPTNNLFLLDDGRLVQWRMRQRTIAGFGNGDWEEVNPQSFTYLHFFGIFVNNSVVNAQGMKDTVNNGSPTNVFDGALSNETSATKSETGLFSLRQSGDYELVAVDGECYFHVWGTAERLNQGAYHPSFNPMGTATWRQNGVGYAHWYDRITGFDGYQSTSECFYFQDASGNGVYGGQIGSSSNGIGRDDGRFYDAIYAGGQGGVTDLRLSAWDMSSKEEAAKVFQKVVNGTYRGKEALTYCLVDTRANRGGGWFTSTYYVCALSDEEAAGLVGNPITFVGPTDRVTYVVGSVSSRGDGTYNIFTINGITVPNVSGGSYDEVVITYDTDYSVSGEFTMVDVFADPALILTNPDFANGWLGGWAGIPAAAPNGDVDFTHKVVGGTPTRTYWISSSDTWSSGAMPNFNETLNGSDRGWSSDDTLLYTFTYTAFAKQTKPSTNKPVLNGREGLGDVYTSCYHTTDTGNLLGESLIGKVMTNDPTFSPRIAEMSLLNKALRAEGKLNDVSPSWAGYNHEPIPLAQPVNNSPAVKALWYQMSDNGQVGLNFAYNELKWVGDYADIGVIEINDANRAEDGVAGKVYLTRMTDSVMFFNTNALNNKLLYCEKAFSASWNDVWLQNAKGYAYGTAPAGTTFLRDYGTQSDLWGDNSTVRITDGQSTFININGETCLYGTNELALPYGYIRNQARAGSQVKGIDVRALPLIIPSHYAAVMPYRGEEDVRTNTGTVSHW